VKINSCGARAESEMQFHFIYDNMLASTIYPNLKIMVLGLVFELSLLV